MEEKQDRVLALGEFDDLLQAFRDGQHESIYKNKAIVLNNTLYVLLEFNIEDYVPSNVNVYPQELFKEFIKKQFFK